MFLGLKKIICNLFVRWGYPLEILNYQLHISTDWKKNKQTGQPLWSKLGFVMLCEVAPFVVTSEMRLNLLAQLQVILFS